MVCKKSEVKKIVYDFIKRLGKNGVVVEKAYLFGSYAWGKPNTRSDLDIAIISERFRNWDDIKRLEILSNISRHVYPQMEVDIDVVGFTREELEEAPYFNLAAIIRQKGRIIYDKAA